MTVYELARCESDGTWVNQPFQAADDDDAIDYVLRVRTSAACELRRDNFLFATFDGAIPVGPRETLTVAS